MSAPDPGRDRGALPPTASQTVGPFFGFALAWEDGPFAVPEGHPGAIRIEGSVLDGAGAPVPDALVETWQADPEGRFDHPDDPRGAVARDDFRGFARCPTDDSGGFSILTLKPGSVPGPAGTMQAPHVNVSVFARGLLQRLVTRVYFADEGEANAADPVLAGLPDEAARRTLVAAAVAGGYHFDVRLQGDDETIFFAI